MTEEEVLIKEAAVDKAKITKKDLNKVFWRSHLSQFSHNYERMQSLSSLYALSPILDKLYAGKPDSEKVSAYQRHLMFYNSHPLFNPFIYGITAAVEETTEEEDKDSVIAIKTSLMGPLGGLGDGSLSFTWFAMAGSIGAAFGIQGNPLGPLSMFLIINALYIPLRYYGVHMGYAQGKELLTSGKGKIVLDRITNMSNVVGVTVGAALITTTVNLNLGLTMGEGEALIDFQETLDSIMPNLLPLLVTLLSLYLVKKSEGKWTVRIIFGIIILSILLATFGILV